MRFISRHGVSNYPLVGAFRLSSFGSSTSSCQGLFIVPQSPSLRTQDTGPGEARTS